MKHFLKHDTHCVIVVEKFRQSQNFKSERTKKENKLIQPYFSLTDHGNESLTDVRLSKNLTSNMPILIIHIP